MVTMPKLRKSRRKAIDVTLPENLIDAVDAIADELGSTRGYVLECMIEYCLVEDHLEDLFPSEDEQ